MLRIIAYSLLFILQLAGCAEPTVVSTTATSSPKSVKALRVTSETYQPSQSYLARVEASATAGIRPQVRGIIVAQHFKEGSAVTKGQALYHIDSEPYQAAVELAQARVAEAEAALEIASQKNRRIQALAASNAVSQQAVDESRAESMQAIAQHNVARAVLKQAEIDLANCILRSPIDGIVGQSKVTVGALVSVNQSEPLAVVQQLQPVWVDIQRPLSHQLRLDAAGALVKLVLEDGSELPEFGKVRLVESRVSLSTNSLLTRAEFANTNARLLPGMRANAVLTGAFEQQGIFLPQHSVRRLPSGEGQVMLVNEQSRIELRTLDLAEATDGRWRVAAGLTPGETVVVAGLQKLEPNMEVQVTLLDDPTLANE